MNPELNREYPEPGEDKLIEEMVFSPWNALAEHRPMGGINRLRQAVYLASQAKRGAKSVS